MSTGASFDDAAVLRRRLRVTGRVQGVGFRAWTVHRASRLGLRGRVRNLADGSVEIEVEGASEAVQRLIELARRGPSSALVRNVLDLPPGEDPLPEGFEVAWG